MKRFSTTALASLALATGPLLAQDDHREMGAHVHGVSTLELALEGGILEIDLRSPGMDIVGFEYAATSDADKDAVEAAIRSMLIPENIVTLPEAAECRLTEVLSHLYADDQDHDHEDHAEDDGHDHDNDHEDHADGEEHAHEEHAEDDHDREDGAVHSEFHVSYAFDCAHPEELTTIGFPFFQAFENAQEIEAQYVTETGSGAAEIGRDGAELTLD